MSDKEILDSIERSPEDGFRILVSTYKEPVYWHIRRITVGHHDAEDALQETFLRVFRNIGKFNKSMSLAAWIFKIATNEALRQRRSQKAVLQSLDERTTDGMTADEYVDYSDLEAVKLQMAIQSLPPKQQLAFNLRYYNEFDYATIAEITGSSETNVKANYHVAKEKIIRFMNNHD